MYKIYHLKVTTGEVGPSISAKSCSWSIMINKHEAFTVTIDKKDLAKVHRQWWEPWSGGVLITYIDPYGHENPIIAGPVVDHPEENAYFKTLQGAGIRYIFTKRTIENTLASSDLSYGAIAWELTKAAMQKPGGALPIYHATPYEKATRQRTYEGWNLANNVVDKRLEELSNVINGPDIMFRPEWVPDFYKTRIRWALHTGTHTNPNIPQAWTPDFDTTAIASDISDPKITSRGADMATRVWYTGAGEGEGIIRVNATDLGAVANGTPFLEDVFSDSDQDKVEPLQQKADGSLASKQRMLDQVTFDIQANSAKHPLGTFWVGDICTVTLKGKLAIPSGTHNMRLISMEGNLGPTVTLDFQEEQL